LSLELYKRAMPEYLNRWAEMFECWKKQLSLQAEVVYSGLCYSAAEVAAAVKRFPDLKPDAVVLSPLSYTPSLMTVPELRNCGIPLVIWSTQFADRIAADYTPDDLCMNHTVQGTQDITNVLFRRGMDFAVVTGHYLDALCNARLADCLVAARAARLARRLRTLSLGGMFTGMGDFEFDPDLVSERWGPKFITAEIDEYLAVLAAVNDDEAEKLLEHDLEFFEVPPELDRKTHLDSLRRLLALRSLLGKYHADAFTTNFVALMNDSRCGALPFFGINCLMAEGMGYAGEGDALRAALMAQLRQLAGRANFTEIYTVDFKRNTMLMSHMQECNPAFARRDRKIKLRRQEFWATGVPPYCGMYFTLEPGETTLVTITCDQEGRFRYIAFKGTIPDAGLFPNYDRPYWLLQSETDVSELLDRYSLAGGTHHLIALPGNQLERLRRLAYWQKFDFFDMTLKDKR
ncbi:MAG: hypothetical protein PHV82_05405, partial [Victivallaceae bacterium]|nr:hypothetical protein [Victivallaceae bacterium]